MYMEEGHISGLNNNGYVQLHESEAAWWENYMYVLQLQWIVLCYGSGQMIARYVRIPFRVQKSPWSNMSYGMQVF